MILYTPMQLELVLAGFEKLDRNSEREVTVNGVPAIVKDIGGGKTELVQILSTNPMDFLRSELYPGALVKADS
ncbi:MAG: YlzJ-like family protein [Desulfotomaculaceae bacterium]